MVGRWAWVGMMAAMIMAAMMVGCGEPKPQDYAEADRVRQEAADRAADAAVARAAAQAEAAGTVPSAVARNTLVNVGLGVGAAILSVGAALALGAWLHRRAATVYPNAAGQYPLVLEKNRRTGEVMVHDANRALGASTLYTPAGQAPRQVSAPLAADSATQAQITTQAQAHQLLVAGTRKAGSPADTHQVAQAISENAFRSGGGLPRMPSVQVIADPRRESHLNRLLEGAGAEDDNTTDADDDAAR